MITTHKKVGDIGWLKIPAKYIVALVLACLSFPVLAEVDIVRATIVVQGVLLNRTAAYRSASQSRQNFAMPGLRNARKPTSETTILTTEELAVNLADTKAGIGMLAMVRGADTNCLSPFSPCQ